ncbi:MAG: hypothetical protein JWO44_772 [Bacteroidetes bacterium]|nr:hypothetical protein [Bacteroidota bacterium]
MKLSKHIIFAFLFTVLCGKSFSQGNTPCAATLMVVNSGICATYTAGTTVGATYQNNAANGNTPTCPTAPGRGSPDVWYKFVAPASGQIIITSNTGTITDGVMQLFSSSDNTCTGTLTSVACDDDSGPGSMPQLSLCGLIPGDTYFLRFWMYGSAAANVGTFSICFYIPAPGASLQNCNGGTQVCSNASFVGNSSGSGAQELNVCNQGCLSTEHNSSWYYVNIGSTGTLQLTIAPSSGSDDYDFALWGPTNACPPPADPIRCSWAASAGNTGINSANNSPQTDNSEGAGGNRWVQNLAVTAGDVYVLLVDGYTASAAPYTLSWNTGGGSSTLSCVPVVLPVELLSFEANLDVSKVLVKWVTATETNNDYFTLERSQDGTTFEEVLKVDGQGSSSAVHEYMETDFNPYEGVSYYRLKQTDFNGVFVYSNIVPVEYHANGDFGFSIFPNPGNASDVKIQLNAAKGQEILVVVRDIRGREFYSKVMVIETANGQIEAIDSDHNIAPGVYLVTASSMNVFYSQRLVIKP